MPKKVISFLVCLLLLSTYVLFSHANPVWPSSIENPQDLSIRDDDGIFRIRWKNPDSILKLYDDIQGEGHDLMVVIDWKLNDQEWNITKVQTRTMMRISMIILLNELDH